MNCTRLAKFKENCPEALKGEDESNKGNLCHESWNAINEHVEKCKFIEYFSVFNDSRGKIYSYQFNSTI